MEPEQKKTCISTSGVTSDTLSTLNPMKISQITEDSLMDLFKLCDFRTRCKLRRVSRYWKQVVSMPDVNEIVQVSFLCLSVTNLQFGRAPTERELEIQAQSSTKIEFELSYEFGYYSLDPLRARHADHHRHGMLGPHVRVIIYEGGHGEQEEADGESNTVEAIRSIGMYCTGVQHIVLWHMPTLGGRFRKTSFQNTKAPSKLRTPENVTMVASLALLAWVEMPGCTCPVEVKVALWTDSDESDEEFARKFIVLTPAHRAWLTKWAPQLPEQYHTAAAAGISLQPLIDCTDWAEEQTVTFNLRDGQWDALDPRVLWALTKSILRENIAHEEPLPFDASDYGTK